MMNMGPFYYPPPPIGHNQGVYQQPHAQQYIPVQQQHVPHQQQRFFQPSRSYHFGNESRGYRRNFNPNYSNGMQSRANFRHSRSHVVSRGGSGDLASISFQVVYPNGKSMDVPCPPQAPYEWIENYEENKAEESLNRLLEFGYRRIDHICQTQQQTFKLSKKVPTELAPTPEEPPPPTTTVYHGQYDCTMNPTNFKDAYVYRMRAPTIALQ